MTLISTAFGAVIALGATLVNERFKWRREQAASRRKLCQETYSGFLAALTEAHERMRAESLAEHDTPAVRSLAVLDAFRDAGCYPHRYQLAIVAEQAVLDSAEAAFRQLRKIRDLLADGDTVESASYAELRNRYGTTLRELQGRMRSELDVQRAHLTGGS